MLCCVFFYIVGKYCLDSILQEPHRYCND